MRQTWVTCGAGSVFVEAIGDGPPALVMPVAWGMSHDFHQALLGELDLPLELIYFDAEGTGVSSALPQPWNPARIIDEAEAIRESTGHGQVILFGHASGAFLALGYALEQINHVAAIILVSPFASYTRASDVSAARLEGHPNWAAFQKRVTEIKRAELNAQDRFRAIFKEQRAVDLADYGPHYFQMAEAADEAVFNPRMHDDTETDFLDELHTIDAPVLIVAGMKDPLSPVEESRLIAAELPYVRLVELPTSGHYPYVEEPDLFVQAVSHFIDDIEPADR